MGATQIRIFFFGLAVIVSLSSACACDRTIVDHVWTGTRIKYGSAVADRYAFIAYYDAARDFTVARVDLDSCAIERKQLPSVFEGWDGHHDTVLVVDDAGLVHVAGNMHSDPLVYFRSAEPFDIESLAPAEMVGQDESKVTYPRFFSAGGQLAFLYRDGKAGAGQWFINVWDGAAWHRASEQPLFTSDRNGDTVSAYPSDFEPGPDGFYHMAVVWLGDAGYQNNFRLSYAKTEDFRTWLSHTGEPLQWPLHPDTMDTVDDVGPHQGLTNNAKIAVGEDGTPFITYTKYTANGLNGAFLARPEGNGWRSELLAESRDLTTVDRRKNRGKLPTVSAVRFRKGEATVNARFPGEDVVSVQLADVGVSTPAKERVPGLKRDPLFAEVLSDLVRADLVFSEPTGAGVMFATVAQQPHRDARKSCRKQSGPECDPPPAPLILLTQ